jgi:hypothetical protein
MLRACLISSVGAAIISGSPPWEYQLDLNLAAIPVGIANGHGLVTDRQNNIYFTFQSSPVLNTTKALLRYASDGSGPVQLGLPGPTGLSQGTPHGLHIEYDPVKEEEYLYHANNAQKLFKTNLNGDILWETDFSNWKTAYPQYWPILPTDSVVIPGTDILLLSDGYGSSWVHQIDKYSGKYLNVSFGGKGFSSKPLKMNCPHNIAVEPRPRAGYDWSIVITDRANSRIVWTDPAGNVIDEYAMGVTTPAYEPGMSYPCDVSVRSMGAEGEVAVIPSLGDPWAGGYNNGSVALYGGQNGTTFLSRIEVAKLIGNLGHQHPHDAMMLANGDVVICCWSGPNEPGMGPSKGTISYWHRLH